MCLNIKSFEDFVGKVSCKLSFLSTLNIIFSFLINFRRIQEEVTEYKSSGY